MSIQLSDQEGGELPNTIAYHEGMTTEWTIEINGREIATVCGAIKSENTLYVTLDDPQTSPLYHTVVDIACRRGQGHDGSNIPELVNQIFDEFKTLNVSRVEDGALLKYWNPLETTQQNIGDMLGAPDGNGSCVAWSQFFQQCVRVHGISVGELKIVVIVPIWSQLDQSFMLVKDWSIPGTGSAPAPCDPFTHLESEVTPLTGVPAQGNPNPPPAFLNHWIVRYNEHWYDPSYGAGPIAIVDPENPLLPYEQAAIDGYELLCDSQYVYKTINMNTQELLIIDDDWHP